MLPLIITGWTEHINELASLCHDSKVDYARRWGCELLTLRDKCFPGNLGHPSFQKIRHIKAALDAGECVIWFDADSLITNPDVNPESLFHDVNTLMAASADYDANGRGPDKAWSAGNTAWRPDPIIKTWLRSAMRDESSRWGGLWDQDALQKTQPDGVVFVHPPRVMNAVHPNFNLSASWQPGDFLIHFTGIHQDERVSVAREFMRRHGFING